MKQTRRVCVLLLQVKNNIQISNVWQELETVTTTVETGTFSKAHITLLHITLILVALPFNELWLLKFFTAIIASYNIKCLWKGLSELVSNLRLLKTHYKSRNELTSKWNSPKMADWLRLPPEGPVWEPLCLETDHISLLNSQIRMVTVSKWCVLILRHNNSLTMCPLVQSTCAASHYYSCALSTSRSLTICTSAQLQSESMCQIDETLANGE